jgi:hypothetical protein
MHRTLRLSGFFFALTTVLAGLLDGAAMGLGGADAHYALAGGLIALGMGIGLQRPGPCGHLYIPSALAVGLAAWMLPSYPRWFAFPVILGMTLPLTIVARRLGQTLSSLGTGGRIPLLTGMFLGTLLANFGTGPWLFLPMLVATLLPPPVQNAPDDWKETHPSSFEKASVFMLSLVGAAIFLALHPYITIFDDGSVLQDTRRAVTLFGVFILGWWLLGSALGENNKLRNSGAAVLCGVIAFSLTTSATTASRMSEPEIFNSLVGWIPLLKVVNSPVRLMENHWVWVPILTAVLAALPLITWAAALRATLGSRSKGISTSHGLGLILTGLGFGFLMLGGMDHSYSGDANLTTAFSLAIVGALTCALAAGWRMGIPALAIAIAIPFSQGGKPSLPTTGSPFYGYFQYQLAKNNNGELGQSTGNGSIARVVDRGGGASKFGTFFLADGRNFLTPDPVTDRLWAAEALFPLVLRGKAERILMVGTPHAPSIRALKNAGTRIVHWAVDPPELARVAWGFQPTWLGLELHGLTSTAAEADGEFDYVFVRENACWEQRRGRNLRTAALRHAARRLKPGGMLAISLDPTRILPGMVSQIAEAMGDAVGSKTRFWLMPHGVLVPALVLTAQSAGGDGPQPDGDWQERDGVLEVLESLDNLGYPLQPKFDLDVMEFEPRHDVSSNFSNLLAGPLPHLHLALAGTSPFDKEEMLPFHRAGRVLGGLGAEGSLPWVMAGHENSQVYSLKDSQLVTAESKVDFEFTTLQGLLELARLHPNSSLLKRTCEVFAWSMVERREIEWSVAFTAKLVDEVGWRTPALLWAYGTAWLEMLDLDEAEALAKEALELDPDHELAQTLLKRIRGEEESELESRNEHEGHEEH